MDYFELSGKAALIVGGTPEQKRAEAEVLAAQGATVFVGVLADAAAEKAGPPTTSCEVVALDAGSEASWGRALDAIAARGGRLDILVINAGAPEPGTIAATSLSDLRQALAEQLEPAYLGLRAALPHFAPNGGSVINVGPTAALTGGGGQIGQSLAGWGLRGLTKVAAREFSEQRVRVNAIFHGPGAGAGQAGASVTPRDIAAMVLFLASDRSGFITGAEFLCDGGVTAGMR